MRLNSGKYLRIVQFKKQAEEITEMLVVRGMIVLRKVIAELCRGHSGLSAECVDEYGAGVESHFGGEHLQGEFVARIGRRGEYFHHFLYAVFIYQFGEMHFVQADSP